MKTKSFKRILTSLITLLLVLPMLLLPVNADTAASVAEMLSTGEYVPGEIIVCMKIEVSGVYRTGTKETIFSGINATEIRQLAYNPLVDESPYGIPFDPDNCMMNFDTYRDIYLIKLADVNEMAAVMVLLLERDDVECVEPNAIETLDDDFSYTRPAYSKGDLNGDGAITASDYLMVKRIFLETYNPTMQQVFAADVNGDGTITATDYLMLKRYFYETYYFAPEEMMEQIPLTSTQIEEIKADYLEYLKEEYGEEIFPSLTAADVVLDESYGPYSGCYALFIAHQDWGFIDVVTVDTVAGYNLTYADGQTFMIYKDSSFYDVKTAYESGLITKADVYDLIWRT